MRVTKQDRDALHRDGATGNSIYYIHVMQSSGLAGIGNVVERGFQPQRAVEGEAINKSRNHERNRASIGLANSGNYNVPG